MKTLILTAAAGALFALSTQAVAADAAHGRDLFRDQCGVCHAAGDGDGAGGAAPSLRGVVGRKVGGDPEFTYSPALTDAKDTWSETSLNAFLADPQKAIPGTYMPVKVGADADRADIVAYLATVKK
jgi:cytochrome c